MGHGPLREVRRSRTRWPHGIARRTGRPSRARIRDDPWSRVHHQALPSFLSSLHRMRRASREPKRNRRRASPRRSLIARSVALTGRARMAWLRLLRFGYRFHGLATARFWFGRCRPAGLTHIGGPGLLFGRFLHIQSPPPGWVFYWSATLFARPDVTAIVSGWSMTTISGP
jgi:hypothetical protein